MEKNPGTLLAGVRRGSARICKCLPWPQCPTVAVTTAVQRTQDPATRTSSGVRLSPTATEDWTAAAIVVLWFRFRCAYDRTRGRGQTQGAHKSKTKSWVGWFESMATQTGSAGY